MQVKQRKQSENTLFIPESTGKKKKRKDLWLKMHKIRHIPLYYNYLTIKIPCQENDSSQNYTLKSKKECA